MMKTQTKTELTPQIAGMYIGCLVETIDGKGILQTVTNNDLSIEVILSNECSEWYKTSEIKLILRSLEDMTEDEYDDWDYLIINVKRDMKEVTFNEAKRTAWLINKRFDLFDLIASGDAVRKPR